MTFILKFGGDLSGKFRRRLGAETTWLDLERTSRLISRLNGGDSQVYSKSSAHTYLPSLSSLLCLLVPMVTSCRRSKMMIFPERSTSVRSMTLQHTTHKTYKLKPTIHPQILHASAAAPIRHLMITESAEVDLSVNISSPSSETAGETSATGKLSNSNLL